METTVTAAQKSASKIAMTQWVYLGVALLAGVAIGHYVIPMLNKPPKKDASKNEAPKKSSPTIPKKGEA